MAPEAHQVLTDPDLGSEKVTRPQPVDFFSKSILSFFNLFFNFYLFCHYLSICLASNLSANLSITV